MKVIFIFAHPDDETFSCGGTIAKLKKDRHTIKLICATKGEAGQLGDPPITTAEKLGQVREKEQKCAANVLGISKVYNLGLYDGSLSRLPQKVIIEEISPILKSEKPDVVVTFDKNGVSMHPDHIAMSKAATVAFELYKARAKKNVKLYHVTMPQSYLKKFKQAKLDYSAFGEMVGTPDDQITTVVDISKTYKTKVKAFKCHKTQRKDWERFLKRESVVDVKKEFFCLVTEDNLV